MRARTYDKRLPAADTIRVVDFFAGCGGVSHGLATTRQSHLRFDVLAGIDVDAVALQTYEENVGAPGIRADVREIAANPSSLGDLVPGLEPGDDRPLLFAGCAPCQGFSAHRKKDPRDDARNSLMADFARLCRHWRPDVVLMENVPEILTGRYRHYFAAAGAILEDAGYHVSADVFDFSAFGLPQRRKRAVVLAALEPIALPRPLEPFGKAPVTVRDAIGHLRPVESGQADPDDPWHRAPAHVERILARIRATPPDGGDRRALPPDRQLDCHAAIDGGPTPGFTDVYGRLRWDAPSVTITAKSSTPSCGRFLHPEQHRNITVREAALLQGFPHTYRFLGPFVHQYRQIGEAVPPLVSRHLAARVLDHFRPRAAGPRVEVAPPAVVAVDAFCGAGGISLGTAATGLPTVLAFDVDPDAVATYRENLGEHVERLDVRSEMAARAVAAAVGGNDVVLFGGPPCQGFSQQRRGRDDDARNDLVLAYADLALSLPRAPLGIVLENVTYLDSPRGRAVLDAYVARLTDAGYRVFRHDLNSADYGVAQLRQRIVVVALRPALAAAYEGPVALSADRWPTVGEALAGLPEPGTTARAPSNHQPARETPVNRRRIAFVDMGGGRMWIPEDLQLPCHRRYGGHLDVYGRLDWFAQARTLTGGFDSFTRGEYAHPFRHRSITAREAARLQGFPDDFAFRGNRAAVRRQIGNAVPPPLARAVAGGILAALPSRAAQRDVA